MAEPLGADPLADVPDPAEIVEARTVFDGQVWDVIRETAKLDDGTITREYLAHPGAVAVLAIDDQDRVLLINQYRHPIRTRDWEIPAGLLDVPGESPLLAAQRELAEEADLVAAEWSDPIMFHTSPGGSNEFIQLFEARGLSATPTVHPRTDEEAGIVLRWVALDDAVEAVLDGRLHNAILMIALLASRARRA
ncbi:MAG TPA: NUDIX hydrolase [Pseudolysinimonas sp.]